MTDEEEGFVFTEVADIPDFETKPVRICEEDGCENPCKKRGRGYARYCEDHLFNHTGDDSRPRSRRSTGNVEDVRLVEEKRARSAAKAEAQTKALLAPIQLVFIGKNDLHCAKAIGELAEPIAKNVGDVAADFKLVAKMIDKTDKYLAVTMLALNLTRLGLIIGTHHEVVPYSDAMKLLGIPEPPPKPVDTHSHERSFTVIDGNSEPSLT